jgi:hypothetical protein
LARDLEDKRHRLIARSRLGAPSTPRLLELTVPIFSLASFETDHLKSLDCRGAKIASHSKKSR